MKKQYSPTSDTDLTFDGVNVQDDEENVENSANSRPNAVMQERFMQNCVEVGILTTQGANNGERSSAF